METESSDARDEPKRCASAAAGGLTLGRELRTFAGFLWTDCYEEHRRLSSALPGDPARSSASGVCIVGKAGADAASGADSLYAVGDHGTVV